LNERSLEFYDRNKNVEFRKAIETKYVKFTRIIFAILIIYGAYYAITFYIIAPFAGPYLPKYED